MLLPNSQKKATHTNRAEAVSLTNFKASVLWSMTFALQQHSLQTKLFLPFCHSVLALSTQFNSTRLPHSTAIKAHHHSSRLSVFAHTHLSLSSPVFHPSHPISVSRSNCRITPSSAQDPLSLQLYSAYGYCSYGCNCFFCTVAWSYNSTHEHRQTHTYTQRRHWYTHTHTHSPL